MPLKFFTIHIHHAEGESELNAFLSSHRVLAVHREFVNHGSESCWALCVEYLPSTKNQSAQNSTATTSLKPRVDYREILTEPQFTHFLQLKECRKTLAERDGVPVYTIFTNEQLADMVRNGTADKAGLQAIPGVGEAKIKKYAEVFIQTS